MVVDSRCQPYWYDFPSVVFASVELDSEDETEDTGNACAIHGKSKVCK